MIREVINAKCDAVQYLYTIIETELGEDWEDAEVVEEIRSVVEAVYELGWSDRGVQDGI